MGRVVQATQRVSRGRGGGSPKAKVTGEGRDKGGMRLKLEDQDRGVGRLGLKLRQFQTPPMKLDKTRKPRKNKRKAWPTPVMSGL